jgi:hypothetical protein
MIHVTLEEKLFVAHLRQIVNGVEALEGAYSSSE